MTREAIARILEIKIGTVNTHLDRRLEKRFKNRRQAKEAFDSAPPGSELERLAMESWLSFCTTAAQAKKAFESAQPDSHCERLAMESWLSFCTTAAQFKKVFYSLPNQSGFERLVIQKLAEMPDEE
jgi:hypothetical protein